MTHTLEQTRVGSSAAARPSLDNALVRLGFTHLWQMETDAHATLGGVDGSVVNGTFAHQRLTLTGSGSRVSIDGSLNDPSGLTVVLVARSISVGSLPEVLFGHRDDVSPLIQVTLRRNVTPVDLTVQLRDAGGGQLVALSKQTELAETSLIVLSLDVDGSSHTLWINDTTPVTSSHTFTAGFGSALTTIGATEVAGYGNHFAGEIGRVALRSTPMTQAEYDHLYHAFLQDP